jgi:pimeloyl-ACP methyl ester carboxylesterase
MRSSVPLWEIAAINPLTAYAGQYQMIAMDQRNAGQSAGPLEAGDPWGAYAADQLAVMDHLGTDRFLAFGCCIGGPFILKLCQLAPGTSRRGHPRPAGRDHRGQPETLRQPVETVGRTADEQPRRSHPRRDRGVRHREIAALAPSAELLEPWKDPAHLPAATRAAGQFLKDHTPR